MLHRFICQLQTLKTHLSVSSIQTAFSVVNLFGFHPPACGSKVSLDLARRLLQLASPVSAQAALVAESWWMVGHWVGMATKW